MPENESTEFKKTLGQLKEGLISIAAILNKHGEGELWFGIRDDGIPVGINVGAKTIRDISQAIAAHIEPKIYPEITTETVEKTQCVKIAFAGQEAPYAAYGRQYMRVGDEDRQMSARELENFFSRKNLFAGNWDSSYAGSMKYLKKLYIIFNGYANVCTCYSAYPAFRARYSPRIY